MSRLLLVDDSIDLHLLVRGLLRRHRLTHIELITALDGEAALDAVRDGPAPDLVITDHHMPRCDGPTFAQRLRDGGFDGPILLISSAVIPADGPFAAHLDKADLLHNLPGVLAPWLADA